MTGSTETQRATGAIHLVTDETGRFYHLGGRQVWVVLHHYGDWVAVVSTKREAQKVAEEMVLECHDDLLHNTDAGDVPLEDLRPLTVMGRAYLGSFNRDDVIDWFDWAETYVNPFANDAGRNDCPPLDLFTRDEALYGELGGNYRPGYPNHTLARVHDAADREYQVRLFGRVL